ncbi:MAG: GGDEF domain-containing protein [Pseudomonadota bacterium]
MSNQIERTYDVAEEALGLAKTLKLAADPRNLELLYAHLARNNSTLSSDFYAAVSSDGTMSQDEADRLYSVHIQQSDLAERIAEVIYKLEGEVSKVANAVKQSGSDSNEFKKDIGTLTAEIAGAAASADPSVGSILEGVAKIVQSVSETNEKLESQLAESSDEISFLRESIDTIQHEALTDTLTGIHNRKAFDQSISEILERANETGEPVTLILADVDHFKRFNDRWGHQTGDQVLRLVAEMMKSNVKGKDVLARYGGEEFAIILPDTPIDNGANLANKIREAIGARSLKKRRTNENMGSVTMSMGIATFCDTDTVETLIERADQCLYAAKHQGRNQVFTQEMDLSSVPTPKKPDADAGSSEDSDDEASAVA